MVPRNSTAVPFWGQSNPEYSEFELFVMKTGLQP